MYLPLDELSVVVWSAGGGSIYYRPLIYVTNLKLIVDGYLMTKRQYKLLPFLGNYVQTISVFRILNVFRWKLHISLRMWIVSSSSPSFSLFSLVHISWIAMWLMKCSLCFKSLISCSENRCEDSFKAVSCHLTKNVRNDFRVMEEREVF